MSGGGLWVGWVFSFIFHALCNGVRMFSEELERQLTGAAWQGPRGQPSQAVFILYLLPEGPEVLAGVV